MRKIILGRNQRYSTFVSDEDYAWLVQWRWQYKLSAGRHGRKVYAKRTTTVQGRKVTLLMSHVILEQRMGQPRPGPEYDADHINDDSLLNTRGNLQWELKGINQTRPHRRENYHGNKRVYGNEQARLRRGNQETPGEGAPF